MSQINFNAAEHEPQSFDPIPKGDYPMIAVKSEIKNNKKNTGSYINVEFQVLSGQFQNRKVFKRFNWTTTETSDGAKKAVQIGKGQFSSFCRAANVLTPSATEQLHNIPVIGHVIIRKGDGEYEDQNEVSSFKAMTSSPPPTGQPAPVSAGAPAGKPW